LTRKNGAAGGDRIIQTTIGKLGKISNLFEKYRHKYRQNCWCVASQHGPALSFLTLPPMNTLLFQRRWFAHHSFPDG
jgi:hypothetical protein